MSLIKQCPAGFACHKSICDDNGVPVDYEFVETNSAFDRLTGIMGKDIIGKTISEVLADFPIERHNWFNGYADIAHGGTKEFEQYVNPLNRWCKVTFFPLERNYFATFITESPQRQTPEKEAEQALTAAKEQAKAATKAKSQFLSNMSHEMRTPLNSIIGMADLLAETPLSSTQKEYIQTFKRAGETMLSLVDDILDVSKTGSGSIRFVSSPFNLPEVLAKTAELMSERAAKKNLVLSYKIDPALPSWVSGDQERLGQILHNLIDNAIKFSDGGNIIVNVGPIKPGQEINNCHDGTGLLFSVSDTGPGIPAESLTEIFEEFYQVDSTSTRQHKGSGLGLSISKKLVNLMYGDIWVDSTLGKGSTFYFTAWFKDPNLNPRQEEIASPKPLKVLLVEDSKDNRFLIQHYMKTTPHNLDIAVNGKEAVEKAQATHYDLILMDIQMPIMDGYNATKEIRCWEETNAQKPVSIVALTAYSLAEEVQKMLTNGFDAHLSKPIKKSTLLNLLLPLNSSAKVIV